MKVKREVRPVKESEIPTVVELLDKMLNPNTVLTYSEKEVEFKSPQSAVKSLKVTITSTEALDQKAVSIFHSLHTKICRM